MTDAAHNKPTTLRRVVPLLGLGTLLIVGGCVGEYPNEDIGTSRQFATSYASPKVVMVNQVGYLPGADKVAVVIGSNCASKAFSVTGASPAVTGTTSAASVDAGTGMTVCKANFSALSQAGTFSINVSGVGTSDSFQVKASSLYTELYENAVYYFTYHRLGSQNVSISLPGSAGTTLSRSWSLRPTTALTAYNGWTTGTFNVDGGHADAGDFGLYADNAAQSLWVLMNALEFLAPNAALPKVPEGNLLGEIDYGAKFIAEMLPDNGTALASHKCHDDGWGTQAWGTNASSNNASASVRHCMGPSTSATYSVARVAAHIARLHAAAGNTTKATTYWNVAVDAWNRATANATKLYDTSQSPGAGIGGGDYPDATPNDDKYAAAAEMFLTAKSRGVANGTYKTAITSSTSYKEVDQRFDWAKDATQGTLSLLAYHRKVASISADVDIAAIEANVLARANTILSTVNSNGFPFPDTTWLWGSNKQAMGSQMILAYAYEISSNASYLKGIHRIMDYVMGTNGLKVSFVTGYGGYSEKDTHDRQANGNSPKGWLSGGPQNELINDPVTPNTANAALNYADSGTFANAWASKENTIDWNAPLVWTSYYMRAKEAALGSGGTCTPTTCSALGAQCGSASNGCGGTLSCGTCGSGLSCNASNQCVASCTPTTCSALGAQCGTPSNGCGGTLSCGTCGSGSSCNTSNQCVATGGGTEPCTPQGADRTGGQSGNFNTTGAFCFRTAETINGWGCSNFTGRTMAINSTAKACGGMPMPTKSNGYYYFNASAGALSYASVYWY